MMCLVAAAVRAAIREHAPRRTAAAVATVVAGIVVSAAARLTPSMACSKTRAGPVVMTTAQGFGDPGVLVESV